MNTDPLDTPGASSSLCHRLKERSDGSLVLRADLIWRRLVVVSLCLLPTAMYACYELRVCREVWIAWVIFPLCLSALFGLGQWLSVHFGKRVDFDLPSRQVRFCGLGYPKVTCSFDDVEAVQCIASQQPPQQNHSPWTAYQLNVVLRKGKRHNIVEAGGLAQVETLGRRMASFLNVEYATDADVEIERKASVSRLLWQIPGGIVIGVLTYAWFVGAGILPPPHNQIIATLVSKLSDLLRMARI